MERHLVELSRKLDPAELGRRIRTARLAAGMTQAQAVGGEVSATYLSRIEDGKRRASVGLLERMAERLGVSLEVLLAAPIDEAVLELRVALDSAELKYLSGDSGAALVEVEAVVERLRDVRNVPELVRGSQFLRARALEGVGDYNAAILILEDMTAKPSVDPTWLKAAIALTRCYRQAGEPGRAIEVGERASAQAADLGLEGSTEAIQLSVTVAAAHMIAGDNDVALRVCLRALATAEEHGASPLASASAYWNASAIQSSRGDLAAAAEYAQKALAIFEAADDNRALASLRTSAAELQLAMDPPDPGAALVQLERAEAEMSWAANPDADKADLLVIRARAYLMLGDLDAASTTVDRSALVVPSAAIFVRADVACIAGQVAMARGRMPEATEHFREGVRLLTGASADRRVRNLWYEFAELLEEVGDDDAARQAYKAAAAASGLTPRRRVTSVH